MLAFPPDYTFVVQLVSFFILLVLLKRILFDPFAELLERRRTRTDGAREQAAKDQSAADTLARRIEKALEEARTRASAEAEAIRRETRERETLLFNEAKAEAAAKLTQLRAAIAREREQAKQVLRQEAKGLAGSMVDAVLRPAANQ